MRRSLIFLLLPLIVLLLLLTNAAMATDQPYGAGRARPVISDMTLQKPIVEVLLYSGVGIPAGYVDSTTREDATELCNALIASQSKMYETPISKSRCIIRIAE